MKKKHVLKKKHFRSFKNQLNQKSTENVPVVPAVLLSILLQVWKTGFCQIITSGKYYFK